MSQNSPITGKDLPLLNVIEGLENTPLVEPQVDLEEHRQNLEEQAAAEEFWAGRNLAARNSTRKAA